jgi:hypothetical protein
MQMAGQSSRVTKVALIAINPLICKTLYLELEAEASVSVACQLVRANPAAKASIYRVTIRLVDWSQAYLQADERGLDLAPLRVVGASLESYAARHASFLVTCEP